MRKINEANMLKFSPFMIIIKVPDYYCTQVNKLYAKDKV